MDLLEQFAQASTKQTSLDKSQEMPFNIEAESGLLGGILLNNNTFEHVSDFLRPEHFYVPMHGEIFRCIGLCLERNQIANPITLQNVLTHNPGFEEIGGIKYLINMTDLTYHTMMVRDYGKLLHELYLRRQLIGIGQETALEARIIKTEQSAAAVIEETERRLYNLATKGLDDKSTVSFGTALTKAIQTADLAMKRKSEVVGVTSGFVEIDKYLGGFHSSDLLILAGRPSMGKTALATNFAFNAARIFFETKKDGAPVLFFSLEMSAEQLANRILSSESGIPSDVVRRGAVKHDDFPKLVDVGRRLGDVPLFIDDTPALTITAVRNRSRRMQRQHGVGMIVIDYLQLLTGNGKGGGDGRVQEISEITRGLKALAKELDVPVLALSQLSRAVEQRDDKRPQLSDLRESGSIEQDADIVLFVYREEYYLGRKEPPTGTPKHDEWLAEIRKIENRAEVVIAKQRHGPIGIVPLFFDSKLTKFGNLADAKFRGIEE